MAGGDFAKISIFSALTLLTLFGANAEYLNDKFLTVKKKFGGTGCGYHEEIRARSRIECSTACAQHEQCNSANAIKDDTGYRCVLSSYHTSVNSDSLVDSENSTYMEREIQVHVQEQYTTIMMGVIECALTPLTYNILVTTNSPTGAVVNITSPNSGSPMSIELIVPPIGSAMATLDNSLIPARGVIERKGISISSKDEIVVYGMVNILTTSGLYAALGDNELGENYFVSTWLDAPQHGSQIVITSGSDNSAVQIEFLLPVSANVMYNGVSYQSGDIINIEMNKFDVLYLFANSDFTGTHIMASQPIVVVSGNLCVHIDTNKCDAVLEQMSPVDIWDTEYMTVQFPFGNKDDHYQVVASEVGISVSVDGSLQWTSSFAGDMNIFTFPVNEYHKITASNPIMLTLFSPGQRSDGLGDPFMMTVIGQNRYKNAYNFQTADWADVTYISFLSVVVDQSDLPGMILDGQPLTTYRVITRTYPASPEVVCVELEIDSGLHSLHHSNPSVHFAAYLFGIEDMNGVGTVIR